jgi:hypothetical protein
MEGLRGFSYKERGGYVGDGERWCSGVVKKIEARGRKEGWRKNANLMIE